jgi:hypothetical protein
VRRPLNVVDLLRFKSVLDVFLSDMATRRANQSLRVKNSFKSLSLTYRSKATISAPKRLGALETESFPV